MAEALKLVQKKLVNVIAELSKFADKYKDQPTLAFTHFQPAQPTTVGKRATLWTQEFMMDLEDLEYVLGSLKLLGSKGTTGTQASFLELFDGDQETIDKNRSDDRAEDGIQAVLSGFRTDLLPQSRYKSPEYSCRYCGKCTQDVQRHPPSPAPQGS